MIERLRLISTLRKKELSGTAEATRRAVMTIGRQSSVPSTEVACFGVSDLSRLGMAAWARRSRGPQKKTLQREFTSACRTAARCGLWLARSGRDDRSRQGRYQGTLRVGPESRTPAVVSWACCWSLVELGPGTQPGCTTSGSGWRGDSGLPTLPTLRRTSCWRSCPCIPWPSQRPVGGSSGSSTPTASCAPAWPPRRRSICLPLLRRESSSAQEGKDTNRRARFALSPNDSLSSRGPPSNL